MKKKVSQKLRLKSPAGKVEYARAIVAAMTGNLNFPAPSPTLSAISDAATDLENAIAAAMDGGKSKIAAMHAAERALDNLLTQLGTYVEGTANGDEVMILSSGMGVKAGKSSPKLPEAPAHFTVSSTLAEGEVDLRWDPVKGARAYVIEQCDDVSSLQTRTASTPAPVWKQVSIVTKTRFSIADLESGSKYAYRVFAISPAGYGDYSNTIITKVF